MDRGWTVYHELFRVLTHEAGHQFDYHNSHGTTEGCGGVIHCHDHRGSGSVMSYDSFARVKVTRDESEFMAGPQGMARSTPFFHSGVIFMLTVP